MTRKRAVVPSLVMAAAVLAGCDQTAWIDQVSVAAKPTDAAELAAFLRDGTAGIQSAHVELEVTATGTTITGSGDETLRGGRPETLDLSETIPGAGDVRVVMVDGQTYLQLPPAISPSDKPWLLISSSSSDPRVQQLAASVESVNRSSDLDQYRAFAEAATVTVVGEEQVDGVSTTHYALTVDVTRLPNDTPGRQDFLSVGILRLPVELWVDSEGRPVKVSEQLAVQGQEITSVVTLGNFDEPVTITAPPADQVATG